MFSFARKSLLPLEWTNLPWDGVQRVPEPSWAKQQDWGENTGERQRQGKTAGTFWDLVIYLAHKPLCPEVYCKIRKILPNVRASSELISLCIQLKPSLSKSTSPLPKWHCINHVIVYSLDASAALHDQHPPSMFSFPHNSGICHSSIQISLLLFQNNCKYI